MRRALLNLLPRHGIGKESNKINENVCLCIWTTRPLYMFFYPCEEKGKYSAMNDESSGNVTQEEICNELPNCATSVCDSSDLCGIGEETQQA